ncbi:hypothetical protein BG004_004966 [Podila humilis]|nr:hypothetical protein BG004_004966 [Podila humilis]
MVKFTLLAIVAAVASVSSAAPYRQSALEGFDSRAPRPALGNQCVSGVTLKEYHTFNLKSYNLNSLVSKELDENLVVGGKSGDKNFQELELCVVSSEYGCDNAIKSNCLYEHVPYRFRVNKPIKGYLKVIGNEVEIVDDFAHASNLNFYKGEPNWGLRVAHFKNDGDLDVFSASSSGKPIVLEDVVSNKVSQWFQIHETAENVKPEYVRHRFW